MFYGQWSIFRYAYIVLYSIGLDLRKGKKETTEIEPTELAKVMIIYQSWPSVDCFPVIVNVWAYRTSGKSCSIAKICLIILAELTKKKVHNLVCWVTVNNSQFHAQLMSMANIEDDHTQKNKIFYPRIDIM